MKRIGIFVNPGYNLKLYCAKEQRAFMPSEIESYQKIFKLDCAIVFGGDGTILGAVDFAIEASAPVWGVNLGKLGFLSDLSLSEFKGYVDKLIASDFRTHSRMLLKTEVVRQGKVHYYGFALNDAVIYKGLVSRLIELRCYCNSSFVVETRCDGMIAATPTGSTAYSLSAGGPILSPEMEAIIVAPLCPHVLSVRPMVFPGHDVLRFKLTNVYNETMLQIDGRNVFSLIDGDNVKVRIAEQKIEFITVTGKNFYQTLRKKLHMGKI